MTDATPGTVPAQVAPEAADLCTTCGLCCDGTLFNKAKAYAHDLPGLAAYGLDVVRHHDGERLSFLLPCPHVKDACCTIYQDRFTTCHVFRCALLLKLDRGEVSLAEARATVAVAHALVAAVEPEARTLAGRHVQHRATAVWREIANREQRIAMARRHLAIMALERHLQTFFRKARKAASTG